MIRTQIAFNAQGRRVGATHHRAKLTEKDVVMIIELSEAGLGYRQIAAKFDEMVKMPDGTETPGYRPAWTTIRDVVKGNTRAQPIAKWAWIMSGKDEGESE